MSEKPPESQTLGDENYQDHLTSQNQDQYQENLDDYDEKQQSNQDNENQDEEEPEQQEEDENKDLEENQYNQDEDQNDQNDDQEIEKSMHNSNHSQQLSHKQNSQDYNAQSNHQQSNQQTIHNTNPSQEPSQPVVSNIYYTHNQYILHQFLDKYKKDLEEYFKEFSMEPASNKKQSKYFPKINSSDVPLVMRVGLYLDNITFHEGREREEIFNKSNAYQKILTMVQDWQQKNRKNAKINFREFLEFIEYVIQEGDMFLRRNDESEYSHFKQEQQERQNAFEEQQQEQQQEKTLQMEIQENIEKYQNMIQECDNLKEKQVLIGVVDSLNDQLQKLLSRDRSLSIKSSKTNKSNKSRLNQSRISVSRQENRTKNLKEIFTFYCRIYYVQNDKTTFDRLDHESNIMSLGKFNIFCKQFGIFNTHPKLTKNSVPVVFKKNCHNYREMNISEFKSLLEKVGLLMFENKSEEFPTDFDKVEAFYKFINLDQPNLYRKKFKTLFPAFNIQVPDGFRLLPKDKGRELKMHEIEPSRLEDLKNKKINEKINFLKALEESRLDNSVLQKNMLHGKHRSQGNLNLSIINQSKLSLKPNLPQKKFVYDNYSTRKKKDMEVNQMINPKLNWEDIERSTFTELKQLQQGHFRPEDLFDLQNDPDDNLYLAPYNIEHDKQKAIEKQIEKVYDASNYGNYKESLRPSQKFLLKNDPYYNLGQRYNTSNLHRNHNSGNEFLSSGQSSQSLQIMPHSVKSNISDQYMKRAKQLDQENQLKEKQYLSGMQIRDNQRMQRGMGKNKLNYL